MFCMSDKNRLLRGRNCSCNEDNSAGCWYRHRLGAGGLRLSKILKTKTTWHCCMFFADRIILVASPRSEFPSLMIDVVSFARGTLAPPINSGCSQQAQRAPRFSRCSAAVLPGVRSWSVEGHRGWPLRWDVELRAPATFGGDWETRGDWMKWMDAFLVAPSFFFQFSVSFMWWRVSDPNKNLFVAPVLRPMAWMKSTIFQWHTYVSLYISHVCWLNQYISIFIHKVWLNPHAWWWNAYYHFHPLLCRQSPCLAIWYSSLLVICPYLLIQFNPIISCIRSIRIVTPSYPNDIPLMSLITLLSNSIVETPKNRKNRNSSQC